MYEDTNVKVKWTGYVAVIFAALFFSGVFTGFDNALKALDFTNLLGTFGKLGVVQGDSVKLAANFRGTGGAGVRDAWLFSLSLAPSVVFALGIVKMVEYLEGLKAAQKLLSPLLKPVLGIPGISGLALIASLQSADAGGSMTKMLYEESLITEKERTIFSMFQFSGGGTITNYLASCAALFPFIEVSILLPLLVIFLLKVFGANVMRFYLTKIVKENI